MRAIRSSALWGSMRVSTQAGGLSLSTHCVSSGLALIEENTPLIKSGGKGISVLTSPHQGDPGIRFSF